MYYADPAKEEAYNNWFNTVLIPKVQELDFVGEARRYINVLGDTPLYAGRPKYLALYDIWADDMFKAFEEIRSKTAELAAEGKGFAEHIPVYDTAYKRIAEPNIDEEKMKNPVKGVYAVLCFCKDPAKEDAFNEWYNGKHVVEIIESGLWNTGIRYKAVDPTKPFYHQPPYLSLYETTMDPLEARNGLVARRGLLATDKFWTDVLGLNFTGAYKPIYTAKK